MRFAERRVLQLNYSFNSFCTKQSANYVLGKDEVTGSNPVISSKNPFNHVVLGICFYYMEFLYSKMFCFERHGKAEGLAACDSQTASFLVFPPAIFL